MATISYSGVKPFTLYRGMGSGPNPHILKGFEAASQTYVAGDNLILSSGKMTKVSVGSITSATGFLGWASEDASGTTDTLQEYTVPDSSRVYDIPGVTSAGALAVTSVANFTPGSTYCGYYSATYGLCIDKDTTSNPLFKVDSIVTGPTPFGTMSLGDTGGLVRVRFIATAVAN